MKRFSIGLVLFLTAPLLAVTVSDIEALRLRTESTRAELQAADRSQIEEFWDTTLNMMLLSNTGQAVVDVRRRLEEMIGTEPLSFYNSVYIAAARRALPTAFDNVSRMEDASRQQLMKQNLMVLTAQLKNPALADIALDNINDKDPVVRYWAVKAVTNAGVIQLLSSEITRDEAALAKILNALKERVGFEQQVEIQTMIIHFASAMDHPTAREILLTLADRRIEAYKRWDMDRGDTDSRLLIAMGNIVLMSQDAAVKSDFARKFSELYALAYQAYMKGEGVLTSRQLEQVLSVILEVDRAVLARLLTVTQTGVFRAVQRKVGLDREYETIFGDRSRKGDLATRYNFDYGKDAAGKAITEPPAIGAPPAQ
jgi:hypothetical protein